MGKHILLFDSLWVRGVYEPCPTSPRFSNLCSTVSWQQTVVKVHPKTLQRHARNGLVIGVRVGKLWRFRARDLFSPLFDDENHLGDGQTR